MEYLGREGAPFSGDLWGSIDSAVVSIARKMLKARHFLRITGPVGGGAQFTKIDRSGKTEEFEEWYVKTTNRQVVEIPQLYSDFWLNWRDIEGAKNGERVDLTAAMDAASMLAQHEDEMVFYGIPALSLEGLLTVKGSTGIKRSDWSSGEGAFTDVSAGMNALEKNGKFGRYTLVVSPDVYLQLQRIQPGTGVLESKRIKKLTGGEIIKSTALKDKTAMLICAERRFMDLYIGQDIAAGYVEGVDLNHHLRIIETALLRIKAPDAIVIFK